MDNKLKKGKFSAVTIPMLLLFIVVIALTLLPFVSIFLASFRPGREIMRQGLGLNLDFSSMNLDNYKLLFTGNNQHYFSYFFNSLKLTFLQTTLTLILSSFVAYGFSMYNFRGKALLFGLVLLMMTTPVEILMLTSSRVGFDNSIVTAGINQTKHRILLTVSVDIDVVVPWGTRSTQVQSQVLIADTIVVGQVPESYFSFES